MVIDPQELLECKYSHLLSGLTEGRDALVNGLKLVNMRTKECVTETPEQSNTAHIQQVFMETLDKCFENVCELDLIFHVDKVHNILAKMVMGGMALETNMNKIVTQIDAQNKLEKSEAGLAGAPAQAVSAVKIMNLPETPRNIHIGDISIKVPNLPSFK
ncbi:PREDICTED: AP-3 complex subunit sigma-1-like [Nipponia nippon]|uniref:AP-3 complex subunit sigma-1-like n=1 Tax=Nipponia nippon TaxID=128390 RepID=UPI000511B50E|nr:PREDICTED: AP-3 complex subunit sigma-1-like [Nipponia nippon]